jgi:internalin A
MKTWLRLLWRSVAAIVKTSPPITSTTSGVSGKSARAYNLKNIRGLLTNGFSSDELRILAFDSRVFRPVYERLSQDSGKSEIIQHLLEYADRKFLMEDLLAWAGELNPVKYEEYLPYYGDSSIFTDDNLLPIPKVHVESNDLLLVLIEQAARSGKTELDLTAVELTELPREFGNLTHLSVLNLGNNQLAKLPREIGSLSRLTTLNLHDNRLVEIPPEIGHLTNLTKLTLGGNNLTQLPREIFQLTSLTLLELQDNQLIELPREIGNLTNLTSLNLSRNQLEKLPSKIGDLINLETLNLQQNQLTELSPEIKNLRKLEILNLRDNPLPISREILGQAENPAQIIDAYFQQRRPLNEAKVLLVGQGGVGKTSLVKRLLENQFNAYETKTEGIDIKRWKIRANEQDIRLNIWDFGGQEIMHATHQFFLTKRSLYLLVLNAREDEFKNRVEYWLKLIESFGGASPVIIVINKCDDEKLIDLDRRGLQRKYQSIRAFVETSCMTGWGVEQLKQLVNDEVAKLEHIHDELPTTWFAIKTQLEDMEADYIPYEHYEVMCQTQSITDEAGQRTLIRVLHDLGIVLNFPEDLGLQDTNILNPEWVTTGVYKILNSNALFQNRGVLDLELLSQILNSPAYPKNKHLFIVDMMRKFELCFDFEGFANKRFLVPDLLPKEEPFTGEWHATDCLGFQYHYNVLPSSVMSRFIVRLHPYIYQSTYWRNGVVLAKDKNKALVKADREERKVFIYISGKPETRRAFLAVLRAEYDYIHRTIPKLEAKEKVPLPNHPDIVVDYEHLLTLEELNKVSFVPEGLREEINVKQLLDGLETRIGQHDQPQVKPASENTPLVPSVSDEKTRLSPQKNNPWLSGSFYVFVFVIVMVTFGVMSYYVAWYILPIAFIAGLLAIPIIGVLQSLNDGTLTEKGFLKVILESYKRLFLLKSDSQIQNLPEEDS